MNWILVYLNTVLYALSTDKPSQADGLIADNAGNVYMTEIATNAVSKWTPGIDDNFGESRTILAQVRLLNQYTFNFLGLILIHIQQSPVDLVWPDTVGIDDDGYLYVTTRGWPFDTLSQLIRIDIGTGSYLRPN